MALGCTHSLMNSKIQINGKKIIRHMANVFGNFDAIWRGSASLVEKTKLSVTFCYILRQCLAFDLYFLHKSNRVTFTPTNLHVPLGYDNEHI